MRIDEIFRVVRPTNNKSTIVKVKLQRTPPRETDRWTRKYLSGDKTKNAVRRVLTKDESPSLPAHPTDRPIAGRQWTETPRASGRPGPAVSEVLSSVESDGRASSENERSFAFDVRHTKPLPNRAGILLIVPV